MLRNGTYTLWDVGQITLKNGIYDGESWYIVMGRIAYGDLNDDGVQDAAALISANPTGGSMSVNSFFAILNQGGVPVQSAYEVLGDRMPVDKLTIQWGRIVLDVDLGRWHEPGRPYTPAVMTYQLFNKRLFLTRFTSKAVDGTERAIYITSPVDGTTVTCSLQVSGTISAAPFKNSLDYRILDLAGNMLAEGPFFVEFKDAGDSSTFDLSIDLESIPAGKAIRLEILDANEEYYDALLMLDSVDLLSE